MKNFARCSCIIAAQTGKSVSAGSNTDRAAADSYCVAGFDGGSLQCRPGRPGRHLEIIQTMFDCENPGSSGDLAGESFAAALENHPRYPALRGNRHRALFKLLDDIVASHLSHIAPDLRGLGFDESGIKIYRAAALTAFRIARPSI